MLSLRPSIFLWILSTALLIASVFTLIFSTFSASISVLPVIVSTAELVLFTTSCMEVNILTNSSETCSSSPVAFLIADMVLVKPPNVLWILRTISPISSFLADNFSSFPAIFSLPLSSIDTPVIAALIGIIIILIKLIMPKRITPNTTIIRINATNTSITPLLNNTKIIIIAANTGISNNTAAIIGFLLILALSSITSSIPKKYL